MDNERLTKLSFYRNGIPVFKRNTMELRGRPSCDIIQKLVDRLGIWEETGLSPERCLELAQAEEQGRVVVLSSCDECRYKLQSDAWKYNVYPCSECRQRTQSHFTRTEAEAALLEMEG